jgi:hypothetical protein
MKWFGRKKDKKVDGYVDEDVRAIEEIFVDGLTLHDRTRIEQTDEYRTAEKLGPEAKVYTGPAPQSPEGIELGSEVARKQLSKMARQAEEVVGTNDFQSEHDRSRAQYAQSDIEYPGEDEKGQPYRGQTPLTPGRAVFARTVVEDIE